MMVRLGGERRPDKAEVERALAGALVARAAREFGEGLRHAATHCWSCKRGRPEEGDKCPHCGEDTIPF